MSVSPLVTVAISSYNCANFIIETLDSVKNQTYPNIQLIIVDDCSTDDSVVRINNWLQSYPHDATFLVNEKNMGVSAVFDKAFQLANGKYFSYCGSDDILLPNKLTEQVAILEKSDASTAVVFSDALLLKEDGGFYFGRFIQRNSKLTDYPEGDIFHLLARGNFIPANAALIKTDLMRDVGGFDKTLYFEDWDLWLRLAKKYKFLFMEEPTVYYRIRHNSLEHSGKLGASGDALLMLAKHLDNEHARETYYKNLMYHFFDNPESFKKHKKNINEFFPKTTLHKLSNYGGVLVPVVRGLRKLKNSVWIPK